MLKRINWHSLSRAAGLVAIFALIFFVASSIHPKPQPGILWDLESELESKPQTGQAYLPRVLGLSVDGKVRVPILMYHHIGAVSNPKDPIAVDLTVSPADFESQVQYFSSRGYHTVSLDQAYQAITAGGPLPDKPIAFTFDDGFADALVNGIPILQKYGYIGTFAIATELLGRPTYAQWPDVLAAQKASMEIVSHTQNHLDLTSRVYSDSDLRREIFGSKQIFEQKLGAPVDFFVYPYGRFNPRVIDLVKQAGYKMALTTEFGFANPSDDLLTVPRVRVHGQGGLAKLKRIFDKLK